MGSEKMVSEEDVIYRCASGPINSGKVEKDDQIILYHATEPLLSGALIIIKPEQYSLYNTKPVNTIAYRPPYEVPKTVFDAWKKLNKAKIVEIDNPKELKAHIDRYLKAHPKP